jgi:hypothetical protein
MIVEVVTKYLKKKVNKMNEIDYKDKVKRLTDLKYEKAVYSLPLKYNIKIIRNKPILGKLANGEIDGNFDENFTWQASDNIIDHEYGMKIVFNHLLTIIDDMAQSDTYYMSLLKDYVTTDLGLMMESEYDTKFNK